MGQQLWATDSLGGYLASDSLSQKIRHAAQPMQKIRQFCDAEPGMGKGRGDTLLFDKISNISTQGGTLSETSTIPKNNYTIKQGSLTVVEYGNSIPFTLKAKTLSEVEVPNIVRTVLTNDQAKVLDSAAAAQFVSAKIKAVCTNTATTTITTNGSATATAAASMSDKNVRDVIDQLKKLFVPRYDGQNYISIASTNSIRGLYDYFEAKITNGGDMGAAYRGEVGQYYGCRFIEETNYLSNALGSSSQYGEALFFGADAVREGIVIPEEIRIDLPKDFGRDQAIAWYYMGGFVKTWDFAADAEERIIHVTSK
jgi:N4-gp56 family major capsid protein